MNKFSKKRIKLIVSILLSFVILFIIYKRIDFRELSQVFLHINFQAFSIFFILIIIQLFVAAWRWNILTRELGNVKLSFAISYEQVIGSYSANLIIPGKLGEIVRIPWMRKYSLKTPVVALVLFEKILDISAVIFILFFSILILKILHFQTPFNINIIFYISFAIVVFLLLVFCFKRPVLRKIKTWRESKGKINGNNGSMTYRLINMAGIIDKRSLFYFSITILLWFIQILQFYFIFIMVDIKAPFFYVYSGSCLALLAGALPVSIAGLGTRDAVIIGFFSPFAPLEVLVGIGIISFLRIVIPAFIGLPFFIKQTKNS